MAKHEFTLHIEGELTEERLDDLYEAGADDMTLVGGDGHVGAEATVTREAPSFIEAALSAIRDIEKVQGLRVISIQPDELVSMADIARRLGRTHQSVRYLVEGRRGPGRFPAPAAWIGGRRRVWQWSDVARWTDSALGTSFGAGEQGRAERALNDALALRRSEEALSDDERRELLSLVSLARAS